MKAFEVEIHNLLCLVIYGELSSYWKTEKLKQAEEIKTQ